MIPNILGWGALIFWRVLERTALDDATVLASADCVNANAVTAFSAGSLLVLMMI